MYLNCHSYYSLRYGTLSPEELVDIAAELGIQALALTDIHRTSGVFDFLRACSKKGIKPVVGMEFRGEEDGLLYILLARNAQGFEWINHFATGYQLKQKPWPDRVEAPSDIYVIYPFARRNKLGKLAENEWIGVQWVDRNALWKEKKRAKMLWAQPITFRNKQGYSMHRLLRAIDKNVLLSKLPSSAHANDQEVPISPIKWRELLKDYPELLENAERLLAACSFEFSFEEPKNRQLFGVSREDDFELLSKLAYDGLGYRYKKNDRQARARVDRELKIIHELNYDSYFLITWDIIRYARSRGYFHVGRGSGANSIVAYCLGITDVDPIELDLYFERFINPHRTSPPDFDIDFSWDERDEIIDYIFKRYGSRHVCLLATYVTFKDKSIYRELAKVFGLPKPEIDAWLEPEKAMREADSDLHRLILKYGNLLLDFPNYLSIHAGGILISEKPLANYTVLEPMPKGFPICQFDMYVAEDIGFAKFDVLSQRGLGHIKEAVDIIKRNRQVDVDIHRVQDFKQDAKIREQLEMHETMGCFYIESPAMRQLIKKLDCNNYLTLVAASSIIRPGVASSGMMKEYIQRHHRPNDYVPVHPFMGELMRETYGVMVYQEDVIKVAHYFAGLSLAEADVLRRGMSGKYRSREEFEKIRDQFFINCAQRGYEEGVSREVWRQMESFSGYSFSKAHSASFAVESYQSLYLKTYYPLEFMVAVINNFGGFYRTEFYLHEARRWGAEIEVPDINESEYLTRLEGRVIWMGWVHVKGMEKGVIRQILEARERGVFKSLADFVHRVKLGIEQAVILIRLGAFRGFGIGKKQLLWEAHALLCGKREKQSYVNMEIFPVEYELEENYYPEFVYCAHDDAFDEWEILGFPLSSSMFELVTDLPEDTMDSRLLPFRGGIAGYLVTLKPTRTKKRERMYFGYFVDRRGEYFDTVHFPKDLENYQFQGGGIYWLEGKVIEEFGHRTLQVQKMQKMGIN